MEGRERPGRSGERVGMRRGGEGVKRGGLPGWSEPAGAGGGGRRFPGWAFPGGIDSTEMLRNGFFFFFFTVKDAPAGRAGR